MFDDTKLVQLVINRSLFKENETTEMKLLKFDTMTAVDKQSVRF
jgi:hypothetical protein